MVTTEFINYLKGQIASGQSPEAIKTTLISQGWSESDITAAYSQVEIARPNKVSTSVVTSTQTQPEKPANIFDFKKMKWYEWLALIPAFFLLVQGGAIGGGIGVLGWSISLKVLRNENISGVKKAISVFGITVGYILAYFIIASVFVGIIQGVNKP